jgi:uncharacterized repeat protein (TIGR03809 family)
MTDEQPLRRFNNTAEKWRDLAEKRRLYFEELHQSGRWKYYYTESQFYQRLGKAAELVDLWEPVLKARLTELPSAPKSVPPKSAPPKSVPPNSAPLNSAPQNLPPKSPPMSLPSPMPEPTSSPTLSMRLGALPRRRAV